MTAAARLAAGAAAAFVILIAGLFGGPAEAQMPGQQVSLTPEIVDRFIESMPAVKTTAEGLQDKYGVKSDGFGDDPAGRWQAWLAYSDAQSELEQVCQQYGFADFPTWVATFSSVATAHAFARQGGSLDSQMAQAVEAIRNNPDLTDAQKEMMMKQFEASTGSLNAMRPSQQNLDAVEPYSDRLDTLFKDS